MQLQSIRGKDPFVLTRHQNQLVKQIWVLHYSENLHFRFLRKVVFFPLFQLVLFLSAKGVVQVSDSERGTSWIAQGETFSSICEHKLWHVLHVFLTCNTCQQTAVWLKLANTYRSNVLIWEGQMCVYLFLNRTPATESTADVGSWNEDKINMTDFTETRKKCILKRLNKEKLCNLWSVFC